MNLTTARPQLGLLCITIQQQSPKTAKTSSRATLVTLQLTREGGRSPHPHSRLWNVCKHWLLDVVVTSLNHFPPPWCTAQLTRVFTLTLIPYPPPDDEIIPNLQRYPEEFDRLRERFDRDNRWLELSGRVSAVCRVPSTLSLTTAATRPAFQDWLTHSTGVDFKRRSYLLGNRPAQQYTVTTIIIIIIVVVIALENVVRSGLSWLI